MNLDADDFTLLGLPRAFALDRAKLDAAWKALQARVHPDRFAAEGAAAQRVAMQWAVRVNEAHQRLKDPLKRAAYLCQLAGVAVNAESNTAMPGDFLMQQMTWREALDEVGNAAEAQSLLDEVSAERRERLARVTRLLDVDGNAAEASQEVRALMFIDRLSDEIDTRLERYEDQA
ncbi:Fe-S protein assembly co-chaperone HscB [Aquabacterium soli]|jgi:molecular chaperone HscB|uniref:Co-chaperone protein HscB homolog n=1 Tax=Aquabacterium soli TaxID=2493092 RepID=A0A3R8TAN9_9BURK|nr:Fe-S protein assembly co-chaperone HscB [Aquabacterium soli]RRS03362.1 Fe-S protein assembly co-chaperone HscB [Aquabacterium soli]